MSLALPYTITEPLDAIAIQGNFDVIKTQFPLGRGALKLEAPAVVSGFVGGWLNFGLPYQELHYWRDGVGLVHLEGRIKSGSSGSVIFNLPNKYRPANTLEFVVATNTGYGVVEVRANGDVVHMAGGTGSVSLSIPPFRQEQ